VFERARVGIARVAFEGERWLEVNDAFCSMLGYSREELLAEPWTAITHPNDVNLDLVPFRKMAAGDLEQYVVEKRFLRKDGEHLWCRLNLSLVRDSRGRPDFEICVVEDVSERRAAELALRISEERARDDALRVRLALDAGAIIGTWLWDLTTDRFAVDEQFAEAFGLDPALGRHGLPLEQVIATVHPDDKAGLVEAIDEAVERGGPYARQYRVRRVDGQYHWIEANGRVDKDEHGIATFFPGVLLNVEQRRTIELERDRALQLLRQFADAVPGVAYAKDREGRMLVANRGTTELIGKLPEAYLGKTDEEFLDDPEQARTVMANDQRIMASGEVEQVEELISYSDGRRAVWLSTKAPLKDDDGQVVGLIGSSIDITDRKNAEDELARTSSLLHLIGDSTPDLIYAKDSMSRMLYVNAAAQRTIGRPYSEILGHSDLDFATDQSQAEDNIAHDRVVMESGQTIDVDETFTSPSGETRHYRSVKAPLRDTGGSIVGVVGITSDVTGRREAEERERLLAREVDHRSKNLLGVVQSVVQLTRAADISEFKASVNGRIQALGRAHSLLAASRWEGVDIDKLVREELAPFMRLGSERTAISGKLLRLRPSASQALAMAIHELATNAAKYGSLSTEAGTLTVSWHETGTGSSRLLELVWNERGGPPAKTPTRHGFGSTIIRSTVEQQLSGRLEMDWGLEGLTCRMVVPAEQLAETLNPTDQVATKNAVPEDVTARLHGRVLIVEDEALIALQIEETVQALGCQVIGIATSVESAFEVLRDQTPDVAILDVNLGKERSDRIAQALLTLEIPFAYCTGYADTADLVEPPGGAERLAKPLDAQLLAGAVRRMLIRKIAPS
jgi:PAS domain S-box-containing protein